MKSLNMFAVALAAFMAVANASAQPQLMKEKNPEFFKTERAAMIGDEMLLYQRVTGGWPKNIDMTVALSRDEIDAILASRNVTDDSTTDNDATNTQIYFLARLYNATGEAKYKDAVGKGVAYLLSGQYENGGWPQFWPGMQGYQKHITYNDNAMVNTMRLLGRVAEGKAPFKGDIIDKAIRERAAEAFRKGVECILATQIVVDGEPTVWCQQHDRETLAPAAARTYELPSFCSMESVAIVELLMDLPNPDDRVRRAIDGALKWFDANKITGVRVIRAFKDDVDKDTHLVEDPDAGPIWARFYDLEECRPFFCGRDGIMRRDISEIEWERRNGYAWYTDAPARLFSVFQE